jgi:hypothetical protein
LILTDALQITSDEVPDGMRRTVVKRESCRSYLLAQVLGWRNASALRLGLPKEMGFTIAAANRPTTLSDSILADSRNALGSHRHYSGAKYKWLRNPEPLQLPWRSSLSS